MTGSLEGFQGQEVAELRQRKTVPAIGTYSVACAANHKAYGGWSKNVHNRLGWHKSHLRKGNHPIAELQADFLKHGENNFTFTIVNLYATEEEAVKEEALLIAELFKNGLAYNRIVPNSSMAKVRAKRKSAVKPYITLRNQSEADRLKQIYYGIIQRHKAEYLRDASAFWDVMVFLDYRDEEQFFLLVDAFLRLTGAGEAVMCLNAFGNPAFVHNIRIGMFGPFSYDQAKVVQDYISKEMVRRSNAYRAEASFARDRWLEAMKAEDAQKERAAA
jgi:hypothetical protein